jgi:hypothetical protein
VFPVNPTPPETLILWATESVSGHAQRWAARAATGLSDPDLTAALGYELGIAGGRCGPDSPWHVNYRGGKSPTIEAFSFDDNDAHREWKGAALLAAVRRLHAIGQPAPAGQGTLL